jgi:hypothetical protein
MLSWPHKTPNRGGQSNDGMGKARRAETFNIQHSTPNIEIFAGFTRPSH